MEAHARVLAFKRLKGATGSRLESQPGLRSEIKIKTKKRAKKKN